MASAARNTDQKPYHHGDLRRALLDASIGLLEEQGSHALTLREVARRAGVSHAAPYRHFADKDELIAAVAEEGFATLKERMMEAAMKAETSIEGLEQSGVAYVKLALEHPGHCSVMFGRDAFELKQRRMEKDRASDDADAGHTAFEGLVQLIERCQRDGFIRDGDPRAYANICWTQVHGIATLAMSRLLEDSDGAPLPDEQTIAFVERCVKNLTRGFAAE